MHPTTFLRVVTRAIFILISLVVMLTACGSNSSKSGQTATPGPILTPSSTSVVNQDGTSNPNKGPVSLNVAGLNIYSSEGIQCPLGAPTIINISGKRGPYPNSGSDQLVLATPRLTYGQDEIQQMIKYLHSIFTSGNIASSFLTNPPATLRWVPGSDFCTGAFEITNNGDTPIQISTVGIHIIGAPQQNGYQYRIIDACTLLPDTDQGGTPCNFAASGSGNCSVYFANIHLQDAKANSVFTSAPMAFGEGQTCHELMINPKGTTDLYIAFNSSDTSNSFIYSVMPELTLTDVNGTRTVSLPQLVSTLAFANAGQISCYGLQGNTFVPEKIPAGPSAPPQYCM